MENDPLLFVYASLLCLASYYSGITLGISFVPIGLIGTAVAFYVGFKNNSSYERLWEARRIWGAIVNASRTWGTYTITYIQPLPDDPAFNHYEVRSQLIHRQIAYINAIRIQLRAKSAWNDTTSTAHNIVKDQIEHHDSPLLHSTSQFMRAEETQYVLSKKTPQRIS